MPYRDSIFEDEQPFHIIGRAVEERKIFANRSDCYRFIFQMYAANIGKPCANFRRTDVAKAAQSLLKGEEIDDGLITREHEPLVHILDFCLNMTHYHFYLIPTSRKSIPLFIKKLNGGFAKFFNLKYHRSGTLFSSRYKSVAVKSDFQSDAVSRYVSITNPLDIYQPGWRENGLLNKKKALEFLKSYEFSSFPDKVGERNSKILAPINVLKKYELNDYKNFAESFLQQRLALPKIAPV